MPELTGGQLASLRTYPQRSNIYLIVQQPQIRVGGVWQDYLWSCQIDGNPAGTAGDLVASLTVDNGDVGPTLILSGMTVMIGTNKGDHDKGIYVLRIGQNADNATVNLDIGSTSEIIDNVEDDDWVVVLDEFRLWTRYPRITEAGGVISWFKNYDLAYAALGGTPAARRQASLPAVPVMGPHVVQFIDPDSTVDVDFDWSDSYTMSPGASTNAWTSDGLRGATSGDWASAVENPPAQTYDGSSTDANNDISGLAGYRVSLLLGTDQQDPANRYLRGARYVFTLRRPGERVAGVDPAHAEPITDFEWSSAQGSWDDGGWRATLTVFGSQASEYDISEGALTILFADDWYGAARESVGPLSGRENIIMVGRIADGSIREDSETGDVTFDVVSASGQAKNRDMYPIPVEYDDAADEWYKCPSLTVDRAAWFYLIWHSTLATICDWYPSGDTESIAAMDFLSGDVHSTLDSFYQDRLVARVLCDRYERFKAEVDLQIGVEGAGTTVMTLTDEDWFTELSFREAIEKPVSIVEIGGINYNAGLITPHLGKAPGTVNRSMGSQFQNTSMAVASQAALNTIAGRLLAKMNSRWPEGTIEMGNYRVFDVWPQEYIVVNAVTQRHTFANNFIPRQMTIDHENGVVTTTIGIEMEEGGVDGQTIEIPDELPNIPPPPIPEYPPGPIPTPTDPGAIDSGRRIIATDVGVFATNEIGDLPPTYYAANNGFVTAEDLNIYDIKRDPFHWWTSGGTERTLWASTQTGIWKHENFPYGTWVNTLTLAALAAASEPTWTLDAALGGRIALSIEVEGRMCLVATIVRTILPYNCYGYVINGGAITNATKFFGTNDGWGYNDARFAPHSGGNTIYAASDRAPFNAGSGEAKLWKTINAGAGWANISTISAASRGEFTAISIPYIDAASTDQYIFWGVGGGVAGQIGLWRESINAGLTFANMVLPNTSFSRMGTGGHPNNIAFIAYDAPTAYSAWSNDNGVTYVTLPLYGIAGTEILGTLVGWSGGQPQTVLTGSFDMTLGDVAVWLWSSGQSAWTDKTGNLNVFGVSEIRAIERDTMGSA